MMEDLEAVCKWAADIKLIVNADKSLAITIGSSHLNDVPPVVLNGTIILYSASVKSLGLIINNTLVWGDQANSIVTKVIAGLRSLWILSNSTPVGTRLILAKSL